MGFTIEKYQSPCWQPAIRSEITERVAAMKDRSAAPLLLSYWLYQMNVNDRNRFKRDGHRATVSVGFGHSAST